MLHPNKHRRNRWYQHIYSDMLVQTHIDRSQSKHSRQHQLDLVLLADDHPRYIFLQGIGQLGYHLNRHDIHDLFHLIQVFFYNNTAAGEFQAFLHPEAMFLQNLHCIPPNYLL